MEPQAITSIWEITDLAKDSNGRVRQQSYLNFNSKMYFAMVEPDVIVSGAAADLDKEARLSGEDDWCV